jgi:hypothetical protein
MEHLFDISRRALTHSAVLGTLILAGACGDDTTEPEPEPEIVTIRVTAGASTVDIAHSTTGAQTPGPLTLRTGQVNAVSFRFLGANGQDEPIVVDERADLELTLTVPAGWAWTATGGSGATFTANITPGQTGTATFQLTLFNTDHGHEEIDDRPVSVNVTQ